MLRRSRMRSDFSLKNKRVAKSFSEKEAFARRIWNIRVFAQIFKEKGIVYVRMHATGDDKTRGHLINLLNIRACRSKHDTV